MWQENTGLGSVEAREGKVWNGLQEMQEKTLQDRLRCRNQKKQTPDPASGRVNTWLFQLLWNTLLPTKTSFKAQPAGAQAPLGSRQGQMFPTGQGLQCKANCKPEFLPCTVRINSATLLQEQTLVHSPALWVTPQPSHPWKQLLLQLL